MPTETEHVALANRNHDAMMHLISDPDRFPEWVATIGFYKALTDRFCETSLRIEFIKPMFELPGWDIRNRQSYRVAQNTPLPILLGD